MVDAKHKFSRFEYNDFNGMQVSNWSKATELSEFAYHCNMEMKEYSNESWNDPFVCADLVGTTFAYWGWVRSLMRQVPDNQAMADQIDKDFRRSFRIAMEMPYVHDAKKRFDLTFKLNMFVNEIKNVAQRTGWGLPVKKPEPTSGDLLESMKTGV